MPGALAEKDRAAPVQHVVVRPAIDDVLAVVRHEHVRAEAAGQHVVAHAAIEVVRTVVLWVEFSLVAALRVEAAIE